MLPCGFIGPRWRRGTSRLPGWPQNHAGSKRCSQQLRFIRKKFSRSFLSANCELAIFFGMTWMNHLRSKNKYHPIFSSWYTSFSPTNIPPLSFFLISCLSQQTKPFPNGFPQIVSQVPELVVEITNHRANSFEGRPRLWQFDLWKTPRIGGSKPQHKRCNLFHRRWKKVGGLAEGDPGDPQKYGGIFQK